jgi:hypothetical protein
VLQSGGSFGDGRDFDVCFDKLDSDECGRKITEKPGQMEKETL